MSLSNFHSNTNTQIMKFWYLLCCYNRWNRKRESVRKGIQSGGKNFINWAKCTLLTGLPWCLRLYRVCLQLRRPRFNPWVRKIPWRREWQSTSVFLPGEFHQQRCLAGYIGSQRVGHNWATFTSDYSEVLTNTWFVKMLSSHVFLLFKKLLEKIVLYSICLFLKSKNYIHVFVFF